MKIVQVIALTANGQIAASQLKRSARSCWHLTWNFISSPELSDVAAWEDLHNQLPNNDFDVRILLISLREFDCTEIKTPAVTLTETADLLQFELHDRLPLAMQEVHCSFALTDRQPDGNRVVVCNTRQPEWELLLANLHKAKIQFDFIAHPFQIIPAEYQDRVYLPDFCATCDSVQTNHLRHMELHQNDSTIVSLETLYTWAADFAETLTHRGYGMIPPLPKQLRLRHNPLLKAVSSVLALSVLVTLGMLFYQHYHERVEIERQLDNRYDEITMQIDRLQGLASESQQQFQAIETLLETVQQPAPDSLLFALNETLADNTYLTNFRLSAQEATITIVSEETAETTATALGKLTGYEIDSIRNQPNPDKTVTVYAVLKEAKGER